MKNGFYCFTQIVTRLSPSKKIMSNFEIKKTRKCISSVDTSMC